MPENSGGQRWDLRKKMWRLLSCQQEEVTEDMIAGPVIAPIEECSECPKNRPLFRKRWTPGKNIFVILGELVALVSGSTNGSEKEKRRQKARPLNPGSDF